VDTNGTSTDLPLGGVPDGDYFIVVRHRNHIAVMSRMAQTLGETSPFEYDFTASTLNYFGEEAASLTGGFLGMFAGDTDGSGTVDANDRSATWNDRNAVGYSSSDCGLTGTVDANDRSITWNNRNRSTHVPVSL
jgi:hypothetical protein